MLFTLRDRIHNRFKMESPCDFLEDEATSLNMVSKLKRAIQPNQDSDLKQGPIYKYLDSSL